MKDAFCDIFGELIKSVEPEVSEWGNPVEVIIHHRSLNK